MTDFKKTFIYQSTIAGIGDCEKLYAGIKKAHIISKNDEDKTVAHLIAAMKANKVITIGAEKLIKQHFDAIRRDRDNALPANASIDVMISSRIASSNDCIRRLEHYIDETDSFNVQGELSDMAPRIRYSQLVSAENEHELVRDRILLKVIGGIRDTLRDFLKGKILELQQKIALALQDQIRAKEIGQDLKNRSDQEYALAQSTPAEATQPPLDYYGAVIASIVKKMLSYDSKRQPGFIAQKSSAEWVEDIMTNSQRFFPVRPNLSDIYSHDFLENWNSDHRPHRGLQEIFLHGRTNDLTLLEAPANFPTTGLSNVQRMPSNSLKEVSLLTISIVPLFALKDYVEPSPKNNEEFFQHSPDISPEAQKRYITHKPSNYEVTPAPFNSSANYDEGHSHDDLTPCRLGWEQ